MNGVIAAGALMAFLTALFYVSAISIAVLIVLRLCRLSWLWALIYSFMVFTVLWRYWAV